VTHKPAPQQRRAGFQAYLLVKYEEVGTLHGAFWELAHLHDREPESYRRIAGSDRLFSYETLHRYWKEIPLTKRRAARQRYLRRN
jgi:hypothetical protein